MKTEVVYLSRRYGKTKALREAAAGAPASVLLIVAPGVAIKMEASSTSVAFSAVLGPLRSGESKVPPRPMVKR